MLGNVAFNAFGYSIGGNGQTASQPQPDGSLLDPTGLRADSTGNGLYNPGTGTGVNDGDEGDGTEGLGSLRNRLGFGLKNLLASAPFQPGSAGREFFANAIRMVPFAGAAYSGYAAATGKDPIAGKCEGIGPRILDGLGAAGGLMDALPGIRNGASVNEYDTVRYRPSNSGFENHHGILDKWASENIPGYVSRAADNPTMALSPENHAATKAVFRDWLREQTGSPVGGRVDWQSISFAEIQRLAERMFDAAHAPESARAAYYRAFYQYISSIR